MFEGRRTESTGAAPFGCSYVEEEMTEPGVSALVAEGVLWLVENRPGWPKEVDLDILDMSTPRLCILGQTGGWHCDYGFWKIFDALGGEWLYEHGFDVKSGTPYEDEQRHYQELKHEWTRVITGWRAGATR